MIVSLNLFSRISSFFNTNIDNSVSNKYNPIMNKWIDLFILHRFYIGFIDFNLRTPLTTICNLTATSVLQMELTSLSRPFQETNAILSSCNSITHLTATILVEDLNKENNRTLNSSKFKEYICVCYQKEGNNQ